MPREINLRPNKGVQEPAKVEAREDSSKLEIAALRVSLGELEAVVEQLINQEPPEKVVERTEVVREVPVVQETIVLEDPRFSKLEADMGAISKSLDQLKKKRPENVVVYGGNNVSSGGGGVTDGDKGDIVVSNSGATWSIDSGVLTAAGRALIDDANAGAQRSTLGLQGSGVGLAPAGGTTSQVLAKVSNSDYDYTWSSAAAGGGGTQYAEDTAHVSGDLGDQVLAVRSDTLASKVSADGDYSPLQVNASGALYVVQSAAVPITDNSGSITVDNGGTFAVQATLAAETTKVIGTVNVAAAQTIGLAAGTNAIGKLAANSGIDIGDVDVTSVIPGTAATNLGKAEDAAHTSGDVGVMALAVRNDAGTALAGTTGDYIPLTTDSTGALRVTGSSGGTSMTDAAAFTRATTSVTPIAAVVETSAPTLTNGNVGALSLTTGGALRVAVASGGVSGVVEDAASAGGEEGILSMVTRQDTIASSTSADGDFTNLKSNSVGALYTSLSHIGANAVSTGNGTAGTGTQRVTIASDNTAFSVNATEQAGTTGGMTPSVTISAASTNATSLKASAGQVYSITVSSVNAAMRYLKLYNKASAPTVGTDTPVYVVPVPGNTAGAGATIVFPCGLSFGTGIAWALTAGIAHTDTTAVSANEHVVSIGYK